MAGKKISKAREGLLKRAYKALEEIFATAEIDPNDEDVSEAGGFTRNDEAKLLADAVLTLMPTKDDNNDRYVPPYTIADIYDDRLVYRAGWDGPFYQCDYTISDDGIVTLGTPALVVRKVDYIEPGSASLDTEESDYNVEYEYIPLVESALDHDGNGRIKIIKPGWGSSAYYPTDVLKRDGPRVFRAGTHMLWDHPTAREEAERPEGSLTRLAATLTEDAYWADDPKHGPGLYAKIHVKKQYRDHVDDMRNDIGTSIRAGGKARMGEAEGRKGPILTSLDKAKTIDFVTRAGAGGKVLSLFEAARNNDIEIEESTDNSTGETTMPMSEDDLAKIAQLIDSKITPLQESLARANDANLLRDARDYVARHVATIKNLPKLAHDRVIDRAMQEAQRTDAGTIDLVKLAESANTAAQAELDYLYRSGAINRRPEGLGETRSISESDRNVDRSKVATEELETIFSNWGLSETAAKRAAKGRS